MLEATTTEFTKNFGRYREAVQREPIAVMNHGRPTAYLVSASEYEQYQRLMQLARQSFATKDLSAEQIDAIAKGRMSPEHDHLNALLDPK
ncbi:MAG TPA: type II toxin-antitoxin system Phd/YefM family antitoxin [Bosea sp. (in: a-proteobacteria)]|jgi:prevent-host-death family protein|uniref:type II toxin-antitoxin system Phd/YefM family antitoxin n=1 Tax=Bosea sp. (in: a-proteobacteria) TaxID=1871050 RepID=UPI002DDD97F8|nr:type II toxin-antitoxin system Phd/YefM family antitoxin [Bosea sp. (in: a-proteobacteria)]HEV2553229.1 type II toxin-antitoxin system Phd/YefM family antitoxin [Bosea sp. (in: a-proteobacteria)]